MEATSQNAPEGETMMEEEQCGGEENSSRQEEVGQVMEDTVSKIQSQQDSAYGSLECSSQGQSQKSSGSGSGSGGGRAKSMNSQSSFSTGHSNSKSQISSSSHSSGFDHDFRMKQASWMKDKQHKEHSHTHSSYAHPHKKKKGKEKTEKTEKCTAIPVKDEPPEPVSQEEDTAQKNLSCKNSHEDIPRAENMKNFDMHYNPSSFMLNQAMGQILRRIEKNNGQGVPLTSPKAASPTPEQPAPSVLNKLICEEAFGMAISMIDGTILEVTSGVSEFLGFPRDMLLGQSFIDFLYPKDSVNFFSKIVHGLRVPFGKETVKVECEYGTSFYCRLRIYHGLKNSGYGVRNKKVDYKPCKVNLSVLNSDVVNGTSMSLVGSILAEVIPINKIYKVADEVPTNPECFIIRHSGSCNFSDYSPEAIPYLGHLPQDLTGNSIFDYYHPDDIPKLKMMYYQVIKEQGKPYRSPPFRFRTFNNSWVTLETEWLCFVNPWSKKIDSFIGQHRVIQGPRDINIFTDPGERMKTPLPDEIQKEYAKAQNEIIDLLSQPVPSYRDPCREPMEKRRKTLVNMMVPFVDQLDNMEKNESISPFREEFRAMISGRRHHNVLSRHHLSSDLPTPGEGGTGGSSNSPPQEEKCCESTTRSSHTPSPLSYSNLNFSYTIDRFFNSQPKTISSDEENKMQASHSDSPVYNTDEGKSSSPFPQSASVSVNRKTKSQSQSQESSSGDNVYNSTNTGNLSGESGSGKNRSLQSYTPVALTEEVLFRHNQDMQDKFMQTHKKSYKGRAHNTHKSKHRKTQKRNHGVKRTANFLDQDSNGIDEKMIYKTSVQSASTFNKRSSSKFLNSQDHSGSTRPLTQKENRQSLVDSTARGNSNTTFPGLLPPFYVSSGPNESGPSHSNVNMTNNLSHNNNGQTTRNVNGRPQHLPLGAHQTYNPMSPFVVAPHQPFLQPQVQAPLNGQSPSAQMASDDRRFVLESDQEMMQSNDMNKTRKSPSHTVRRPDSQATSLKADVGSAKGSTTSVCGRHVSSHANILDCCRSFAEGNTRPLTINPPSTSILVEAESVESPGKEEKSQDAPGAYTSSDMIMSSSNGSNEDKSSDDSLHNASELQESNQSTSSIPKWNQSRYKGPKPVLNEPSWLDSIHITPQLLYRYQLETKELVDVLRSDMEVLKKVRQPALVDDQLASLYRELEIDGESPDLHLSEGITSSSSSGEELANTSISEGKLKVKMRVKKHPATYYSKMAMVHEEDAPLPPSEDETS